MRGLGLGQSEALICGEHEYLMQCWLAINNTTHRDNRRHVRSLVMELGQKWATVGFKTSISVDNDLDHKSRCWHRATGTRRGEARSEGDCKAS